MSMRYWLSVMKNCTKTVSMRDTVFKMMGLGCRPTKSPTLALVLTDNAGNGVNKSWYTLN